MVYSPAPNQELEFVVRTRSSQPWHDRRTLVARLLESDAINDGTFGTKGAYELLTTVYDPRSGVA